MRSRTELAVDAWESLFRSQVTLMRRFASDDIWDPISVREYDVLFTLSRCPKNKLRLHDLNDEILLSQSSLSRLCDRLVELGFLVRQPDPMPASPFSERSDASMLSESGDTSAMH